MRDLGLGVSSKISAATPRVVLFGPWIGEFGWELMAWQAWCREQAKKYDKVYACSFPDTAPLYEDFAEFVSHEQPRRELRFWVRKEEDPPEVKFVMPSDVTTTVWPHRDYRIGGEFIKFGNKLPSGFTCLVHASNHTLKSKLCKNYPKELWREVVKGLPGSIACVGTKTDLHIEGAEDLRGVPLDELMNLMASCQVVIGGSSGPMHLACLCGATIVVWSPVNRWSGDTLEERYKTTWNPFGTRVEYIRADNWIPVPHEVLLQVAKVVDL